MWQDLLGDLQTKEWNFLSQHHDWTILCLSLFLLSFNNRPVKCWVTGNSISIPHAFSLTFYYKTGLCIPVLSISIEAGLNNKKRENVIDCHAWPVSPFPLPSFMSRPCIKDSQLPHADTFSMSGPYHRLTAQSRSVCRWRSRPREWRFTVSPTSLLDGISYFFFS